MSHFTKTAVYMYKCTYSCLSRLVDSINSTPLYCYVGGITKTSVFVTITLFHKLNYNSIAGDGLVMNIY